MKELFGRAIKLYYPDSQIYLYPIKQASPPRDKSFLIEINSDSWKRHDQQNREINANFIIHYYDTDDELGGERCDNVKETLMGMDAFWTDDYLVNFDINAATSYSYRGILTYMCTASIMVDRKLEDSELLQEYTLNTDIRFQ
jgi:hypothetical protein